MVRNGRSSTEKRFRDFDRRLREGRQHPPGDGDDDQPVSIRAPVKGRLDLPATGALPVAFQSAPP